MLEGEGDYGLWTQDISVTEEFVGLGTEQTRCQTAEFRVDCTTRQSGALSLVLVILCSHWSQISTEIQFNIITHYWRQKKGPR